MHGHPGWLLLAELISDKSRVPKQHNASTNTATVTLTLAAVPSASDVSNARTPHAVAVAVAPLITANTLAVLIF